MENAIKLEEKILELVEDVKEKDRYNAFISVLDLDTAEKYCKEMDFTTGVSVGYMALYLYLFGDIKPSTVEYQKFCEEIAYGVYELSFLKNFIMYDYMMKLAKRYQRSTRKKGSF